MARWQRGEAEVQELIDSGQLHQLVGEAANGERLLLRAMTTLETARSAVVTDPDSAFVLAYDAARQALTGILAHQGLRPTTKGGHYAGELAIRAQFGAGFRQFGALRRRRNELEYPERPGDDAINDEAADAVERAVEIVEGSRQLLDGPRTLLTRAGAARLTRVGGQRPQ